MDSEIWVTVLREIIHLIGEDLAIMTKLTVSQYNERKNTYNDPKSMQGTLRISSVSTPKDPSNVGPPGEFTSELDFA